MLKQIFPTTNGDSAISRTFQKKLMASLFILLIVVPLYFQLNPTFWELLGPITGTATCSLVKSMGMAAKCSYAIGRTTLTQADVNTCIKPEASGLLGIMMFFCLWSLVSIWRNTDVRPRNWFLLFGLGAAYMFALNIVRLSLHFYWSVRQSEFANAHPSQIGSALIPYLGWIVYLLGILLFFQFRSVAHKAFNRRLIPA